MSLSRRRFLGTVGAAGGAFLAAPGAISGAVAAPYQVSVRREGATARAESGDAGARLAIPATMPMGSGAPLGGIGTGFVEIRADGCFYEWQIFNAGSWAQDARSTTAPPGPGPQYLRFVLRSHTGPGEAPLIRRLYLRPDESDLYTLPFVQDVESIDYQAWFPMTGLTYNDPTLPVRVSAQAFSPFMPGDARVSGTPGFHVAFALENTSAEAVEVCLAGFLDNPLASALAERRLTNTIHEENGVTSLLMETAAESDFPSGIGNLCFSVTGGVHSRIAGTFKEYVLPGDCRWRTPRVNYMLISVLQQFLTTGRLPDTDGGTDPSLGLPSMAEIDALSDAEYPAVDRAAERRCPAGARFFRCKGWGRARYGAAMRGLLKEVRTNLLGTDGKARMDWGTGALASTVRLAAGQKAEIRFTLSWYFPHHLSTEGREMGHMYSNWFSNAADVNRFLCANYEQHREKTERFARTLADTSCGDAMAFAWSSHLSTMVTNTWWTKDGGYAIWEGLGCCGLSTTDVDYQGSFPVLALFPDLKLEQMRRIIGHQSSAGQVPHTYDGDLDKVDDGFARVDMNPQFVMMVWRDYLWTGDRKYLDTMWPHVQRAMACTEALDSNGDGLPDKDTGLQTYDQWRMRGTPSYIASLWIGALRASARVAAALEKTEEAHRWQELLTKASANFDAMLFNGEYYSLWADGKTRDELCMTDQISGEWFTHMIGLPATISEANLHRALDAIVKYNFNPEFGLHNATAPRGGMGLLTLTNLQAGGLWSGIEFAFASMLIDRGRYDEGARIVDAVHRRYLRAGQPWNHVECGGHYSRAMSSWATLLATTGFKPDVPGETLTIAPGSAGDFHAPWVMASGFGTIRRVGKRLSLQCEEGSLALQRLRLSWIASSARLEDKAVNVRSSPAGHGVVLEFANRFVLEARQTLTVT